MRVFIFSLYLLMGSVKAELFFTITGRDVFKDLFIQYEKAFNVLNESLFYLNFSEKEDVKLSDEMFQSLILLLEFFDLNIESSDLILESFEYDLKLKRRRSFFSLMQVRYDYFKVDLKSFSHHNLINFFLARFFYLKLLLFSDFSSNCLDFVDPEEVEADQLYNLIEQSLMFRLLSYEDCFIPWSLFFDFRAEPLAWLKNEKFYNWYIPIKLRDDFSKNNRLLGITLLKKVLPQINDTWDLFVKSLFFENPLDGKLDFKNVAKVLQVKMTFDFLNGNVN